MAADASGNHVAVWSTQNADGSWSVNAQRFNSAGAAVGNQLQVSSQTSRDQQLPTVSMNANGSFVVTWTNDNGATGSADLYARQFNPDGSPKSSEFLVDSHALGDQMSSSVAVNSAGGFVVTWSSLNQSGSGWAVYAERFDSSGNPIGSAFQVDAADSNDQQYSRVATDADGNFTVIWQSQDGDGSGIFGQRFDSSGNPLGAVFRANSTTAGNQQSADIAMNATGSFVVSWSTDNQDIYAQQFNADGTMLGNEFQVNTTTADQAYGTIYTVSGSGTDIGNQSDQGQFASQEVDGDVTMIARVDSVTYTASNAKAAVMFRDSNAADAIYAIVAVEPGAGVHFEWRDSTGASFDGAAGVGGDAPVWIKLTRTGNDFSAYYSMDGSNWLQIGSTVTIAMQNDYLAGLAVTSANTDALCTAQFSNVAINGVQDPTLTGADIGSPALAGSYSFTDGFQVASPTVAIDNSGAFLITWSSCDQDAPGSWGVYSQLYAASGTAIGPETRVNSTTEGDQANSSVAFLSPTQYVVVWNGNGDGGDSGLYSSVCDATLLGQDVNLPPVNNVPGDQSDGINTPLVFSTDNGNAIQVTDPNIDPNDSSVDVVNSSFESPSGTAYAPSDQGWTFSFSGVTGGGPYDNSGILQNGAWDNPNAPDGQQIGFIEGNGMMSQDVNFAEGGTYVLSLQAAYRNYYTGSSPLNPVVVQVDGITVGTITPDSSDFEGYRTDAFTVTAGVHTVCFIGTAPDNEDRTTYLDAITIDKAESLVSVTLSVDQGTLSLPRLNVDSQENVSKGLVFSEGTGENDTTMTFSGTLADVDAALDGLQYMPDADFAGTAHLQITTNDLASGAVGGAKTTTNTVAINVSTPSQYSGLLGTYYSLDSSTFTPVSRVDSTVDFNWGNQGSPAPGIQGTDWAATWQGTVTADYSEDYTFYVTADDGVRLWVNGQLLCDGWQPEGATEYSSTIHLEAGQSYSIRMDYYQVTGPESAKLEWSSASQAREVIPASALSCANLLGEENAAPVNRVPGDQSATINQPVVFSTDNGNAIQVSDPNSAAAPVFSSSFEDPGMNWGDVSGGQCGGGNEGGWNLTAWDGGVNESAIAANGSPYGNPYAPDGSQVLAIEGNATAWQDVTFNEAGTYTLNFQAAYSNNNQGWSWFNGANPIAVEIDGVVVGTFTPTSNNHFDAYQTDSFTVAAGVHRVSFVGLTNDGSDRVSFIDQVSITENAAAVQPVNASSLSLVFSSSFENPAMNPGDVSGGGNGGGNEGGWNLMTWDGANDESAICANASAYGNPDAPDGSQVLCVQGNATAWQDVTFTEAGKYTLSFLAAYTSNTQGGGWGAGVNPIAVQIDGVTVGTFTPTSNSHYDAFQTDSFTLSAGVHRISFVGLTNDGSDRVSFIDSVSITKTADVLQVALSADNGTLTLAHTDGLAFISGDGVNDSSMTFLGSTDDINAALDGLEFMPTAVDFVGTADVQITTTSLASVLNGGPKSTTSTVAVNVSVPSDYSGLLGSYYNNWDFTGTPVYRIDPTINFDWGNEGSPAPGTAGTGWAADWRGQIQAPTSGTYQFRVTADGGSGLYINGQWICGPWYGSDTGSIDLAAGQSYSFELQYYQAAEAGNVKVEWLVPGQTDWAVIPSDQLSCANLLQPANQAPVNSVPTDVQTGSLNTSFVFSSDQGNAITVSDADSNYNQPLQVTLSVDNGTLTLGSTNWLQFTQGDGSDDSTMTFTGWAGDINNALNGLTYTPTVDFTGNANIQITTNDQAPIFANGGPQSTTSTVAVNYSVPTDYQGLLGTYYNMDGTGATVYRIDPTVNFDWGNQGSPAPGIEGTNWTASWQGTVTADYSGNYTFYATGDDGVRVWVNGQLVCDGWNYQGATEYSGTISLVAGQSYSIRMDYFQGGGGEVASLAWSCSDDQGNELLSKQIIPSSNLSCADLVQQERTAPVNSTPGDQALGINTSLTFSSADGNAISISDPDAEAAALSVPVANSSFESPTGSWYAPYEGDWNYSYDGQGNNSGVLQTGVWDAPPASDGGQVGFIEGTGAISQNINFAEGGTYTISFQAARRDYDTGSNPILIQVDGVNIATITPDSTDLEGYRATFTVSAGDHTVAFIGENPAGGDNVSFIDRVAIDKIDSLVQVQLSVNNGTLQLSETNGLTFSSGSGKNDSEMTMTGTVADINAALDGLQFTPDANYQGTCNLTITTNDLAPAVLGGAKTTTNTLAINVAIPSEYSGLLATYYDNTDLSGVGIQRIDPTIDFSMGGWGSEVSPAPSIPGTNWSACWQGTIQATVTGTYTFYVTGDDGVRLWVNDAYVDGWTPQSATTYTLTTDLVAGQWYTIRMEYFQGGGAEVAKLEWSATDAQGDVLLAREVVPTSQLSCENSAPVNTVPDQQSTDENTPLYFSSATGNAIQVSDLDTIDGTLEVTLQVDHGTLTLASTNGLTFTAGGNGAGSMTFTGAKSDINAALDGLCYTPAVSETGEYISAATLQITTNDMATAMTGGAKTAVSTVSIAIAAPQQYNGLLGTYYNNADFTGTSCQRIDSAIDFDWGDDGSPIQGVDGTTWSARWLGTITPEQTGTYTFYATADDGVRLWVNGQLLIDHLDNTGADTYSATIDLVAGQSYSFRMDYQHISGAADAKLEWSVAGQPPEVISGEDFCTADETPLNVVPSEQFGIGTQPIVFSESSGNAIGVVEAHYDGQPLTVTLTASNGTLALGGEDGLTVATSDDSSTITLTGSLDNINAALDGLTFTRQDGCLGTASIEITSTNPWPSGGPRSSTDTIQIGAVQSSNAGLVATYYSDTCLGTPVATQIDAAINLNGSGGSPAAGVGSSNWSACWDGLIETPQTGAYTFYTTTDAGCRLWVNNQLVIDTWGSQTSATNSATIDLVGGQQYSIRMEYQHFSGTDLAELEWSGPGQSREAVPAGVLSHQDQSPVYYLPGEQTTNENTPLVFDAANGNAITVGDVDAQSGLLQVTLTASNGALTLGDVSGLSSLAYGPDNASVTCTGHLADINAALQGLTFTPSTDHNGGASLHITTTDLGTGKSADDSLPITIVAINQPPTIGLPDSPTIYDYQTLTFSSATGNAIVIGDPDIDPQTSAVTVVNGDFESPNVGVGYYTDQYHGPAPGWTLMPFYWTNGNTVANSSGLAGNGAGIGNPNSTDGTQIAYIQGAANISQNVDFAEAGTYTISFQAAYRQYGGQHAFSVLVDGVSVGTFNPDSLDFRGYSATFSVSAGTHSITFQGAAEGGDKTAFIDHVSIAKTSSLVQVSLTVDHGTLNMAETNGLVFLFGDGVDDASMTFTGSLADVNAALDGLQFTPFAGYMGTANLRITTNDLGNAGLGDPKSTTETLVINLLHVNDPPWNALPSTTQGTYGNQPIVFSTAGSNGITVGDDDAGNNPIQVTLTVSDGTLTLNTTDGLTITDGANGSAAMTLTGTIANLNAALDGLSYTPDAGYIGSDALQVHTDDLGNCGVGGAKTADGTVNISVLGGPVVNSTIDGTQQTSWQSPEAVAADANGNYVVVWSSNQNGNGWDIYARRFDASGNALGGEFLVNSEQTTGDQMYATVAMNADGSFVVTWTDLNGVGGSADVYAKLYNADGSAKGGEFLVNTTTTGDQMYSSVAMDANGGFVVVWSSQGQDGDGWGVYGQRFDASGTAVGAEFQISTDVGDQMFARVAIDGDGDFAVVWQGRSEGGNWNVFGQRFDSDGDAVGSEFQVNTTSTGDQDNPNIGMNAAGDFVVSWTSDGQDILATQYSADGSVDPTYTLQGCGTDIWGNFDQFNYAYTDVSGDVTMTAEVTSVTDTGYWAKCGVMFRDSLDPDAASAMIYVNPSNLVVFHWRLADGQDCCDVYSPGPIDGTVTVKLVRSGDDFTGYYSTDDGVTWTQLGTTQTIVMGDAIKAGLVTDSNNANVACVATFRDVTINGSKDFTLTDQDVGAPNVAGSCVCSSEIQVAGANDDVYTVSGEGNDIGGSSDQGNFASQDVSGDVTIIARVDSMTDTEFNSKAALMLRDGLDADAAHVLIAAMPGQGVTFQWRNSAGEWFSWTAADSSTSFDNMGPLWLKLTRVGDDFSGYYSKDGVNWIQVGSTQTIVMSDTLCAGLAVSSLTNASQTTPALCTAQFSHVTINGSSDLALTDTVLGSPVMAGNCWLGDFPVNSIGAGNRDYSAVAVDDQGDFIVTWSSFGQDTPGEWGVYSQRYTANGVAEGPQTRVNITTDGSQTASSVTALSPDNYMVVWSGSAPGEDAGVFSSEQCPVGLVAQYYNNMNLDGTPVAAEVAPNVNYDWGCEDSPAPGVMGAEWSGTWSGLIKANTSETYTFYATADDGVRVYVNGQLLIDGWNDQSATTYTGSINMLAGHWYQIVVQYYNNRGWESLELEWSSPSIAREVIPCTQFTHSNQAPTVTAPASLGATENQPLTIEDYVSVPVGNSSFEDPSGRAYDYQYGGSYGGWNFDDLTWSSTGSPCSSGIASNGSIYNNPDAVDGYRTAFVQGTGQISQDVDFAADGEYTINFLATYRDAYGGANPIDILIDGVKIATITPNATCYQPYQTVSFMVTAGTHTVTFKGETNDGTDRTSFIDDVSIQSVNGNPLRVGDVDSTGNEPLTVTLSVTNGSLSLNGTDGLTMLAGSGTGDSLMTFEGTASSINSALNGLVFMPDTDFRGQAVLQIVSSDTGGLGGPQTTIKTIDIDVTGPNLPPVNAVPGDQGVDEHQVLTFSAAAGNAISVSDPDAGDLPVQVTLTCTHGTLTLSNVGSDSGLTFLAGDGSNDTTITVQGSMTNINEALDGLQFKPEDNYDGPATLSIETNDLGHCGTGGPQTASSAVTIQVTAVNDPPVNYVPSLQYAYTQYPLTFSDATGNGIHITDPDAGDFPVQVTLSVDQGTLTLGSTDGLASVTGNGTGTITIQDSMAHINAALEGLQFQARDNFQRNACLTVSTDDLGHCGIGGPKTTINTIAIKTSFATPPTIGVPSSVSVDEHQSVIFSQANGNAISVSDPLVGNLPVRVTLSADFGTLSLGSVKGLTFAPGSGPQGTTMTFTGTLANVNAALDGMKFTPYDSQVDATTAIHISVNDLSLGYVGGYVSPDAVNSVSVGLIAVNDPPVITMPRLSGSDPMRITFSSANGNPIRVSDPDIGNNTADLTIKTNDSTFTLASTEGLQILGGSPMQSTFIMVRGTMDAINHALDGLFLQSSSPNGGIQLTVNDRGDVNYQGIGGAQETTETLYVQRMIDPNFQPTNSGALFQTHMGVMNQPVAMLAATGPLHDSQRSAKTEQIDRAQVNALLGTNAVQNMMLQRFDAGGGERAAARLVRNGDTRQTADMSDVKDAKLVNEVRFSADIQNANEPIQEGSALRRDESILVGLGVVSAGYLAWAFNGGSLLAGALSATPMWMPFDPLAVLDFSDRASKSAIPLLAGEPGMAGEENLQSLLE